MKLFFFLVSSWRKTKMNFSTVVIQNSPEMKKSNKREDSWEKLKNYLVEPEETHSSSITMSKMN